MVLSTVQAVSFAGAVAEMNRCGVGECLPTLSAFLLVQVVFFVAVAVVVVYLNVRVTVGAFCVFAHVSSVPANPALKRDARKSARPLAMRWVSQTLRTEHVWAT